MPAQETGKARRHYRAFGRRNHAAIANVKGISRDFRCQGRPVESRERALENHLVHIQNLASLDCFGKKPDRQASKDKLGWPATLRDRVIAMISGHIAGTREQTGGDAKARPKKKLSISRA